MDQTLHFQHQKHQQHHLHSFWREDFQEIFYKDMKVLKCLIKALALNDSFKLIFCSKGRMSVAEDPNRPSTLETNVKNDGDVIEEVEEESDEADTLIYDMVKH